MADELADQVVTGNRVHPWRPDVVGPWQVTFSFGRALVSAVVHTWAGDAANVPAAQETLLDNCRSASEAAR